MSRLPASAPAPLLFVLVAAGGIGAVAAALISQHVFGMQPCPWCTLQRLLFLAMAALALLAAAVRVRAWRIAMALLITALGAGGVAAAAWQNLVASRSSSCNLTLADRIVSATQLDVLVPSVFEVRANCAEAAVRLLGVPYEFWSLALFIVLAGAALHAARRS